ncbi:hypothetical protein G6F52_013972 [Rhizopus delemar]|nr:hypothetical protein G6F52_013972 [Rhizopus delemar]
MRSSVLRRWCDAHGLNILNKTLAYGIPTYLTCRGHAEVSSIVDYYITNMPLVRSASISVALDLSLGSDHKLMSLSFESSSSPLESVSVERTRSSTTVRVHLLLLVCCFA